MHSTSINRSMFFFRLSILTFLYSFLHHSLFTFAANYPIPYSTIGKMEVDNCQCIVNKLLTPNRESPPLAFESSTLKLRKLVLAFGRKNAIATSVIFVITILNIIVYTLRELQEANFAKKLNGSLSMSSEQLCRRFSLAQIQLATHNFDDALVVRKGGFGKVYKGYIDNGTTKVAIKRLNPLSKQGASEFRTEVEMLSKFRHSNIISLIGYCNDWHQMILVYEYMLRGTIADHLHNLGNNGNSPLSWVQRLKICIGSARGLDYLHTGTGVQHRNIHRDVKSSNILLDENWTSKISDFGMSKIGPANQACTHISTNVKGTCGCVDPEYFLTRRLTRKSNVYAFGVILFEVLCGRPAVDLRLPKDQWGLARWAQQCTKEGIVHQIIDPSLRGHISPNSLTTFAQIADQCLHNRAKKRPTMSEVVARLELVLALQEGTDSSVVEREIFNIGGTYDNTKIANSSAVITKGEQIDDIKRLAHASRKQSRNKPAKIVMFTRKVRLLLSVPTRLFSGGRNYPNLAIFSPLIHDLDFLFKKDALASLDVIGRGSCGEVYKAELPGKERKMIAIKKIIIEPGMNATDLIEEDTKLLRFKLHQIEAEIQTAAQIRHWNLVPLLAHISRPNCHYLIYEFMKNGSLQDGLNQVSQGTRELDWLARHRIALGVAAGLEFLHIYHFVPIVHRDIKPANIFLYDDMKARIADFRLAKVVQDANTPIMTTTVARTVGYMAPEYSQTLKFTSKCDIYGFGILLGVLVIGKLPSDEFFENTVEMSFVKWMRNIVMNSKDPVRAIDSKLVGNGFEEQMIRVLEIACYCTLDNPIERPNSKEARSILSQIKHGEA